MDYAKTLQLLDTSFPMKGQLPKLEPHIQKKWQTEQLYARIREQRKGAPSFIVHDGPPYANGNIHIGHALNKVIKDIIVRHKTLQGYDAPFVPGWDTHGLPIEQAIVNSEKVDRKQMSALEFRQRCAAYAQRWVDAQKAQFERLGILGQWDRPYVTMDARYEAQQIRLFGIMMRQGTIYKGLKPVYWSPSSESALAEAEIEYHEKTSPSIVVAFRVQENDSLVVPLETEMLIWTTTPWTLPANVALCVHPDAVYVCVRIERAKQADQEGRIFGCAKERLDALAHMVGWEQWTIVATGTGREWEHLACVHPFVAHRSSRIVCATHVTMDAGTGCVHTAPAHGEEDFAVGMQYGLPVLSWIDGQGKFTPEAGEWAGMFYEKANPAVVERLRSVGALLWAGEIRHPYAHDWRTKKPVIYRATEQWFASIDPLREAMLQEIERVAWTPAWGEVRLHNMISGRSDWCISRQRVWGVPIPVLYCEHCGAVHADEHTNEWIATRVEREGTDAWFADEEAASWMPEGTTCHVCGHDQFRKEKDIMDVWFDSGSSHYAVLGEREGLTFPADVYVEGSDQYRGWFNSSLITSMATRKQAPFRAVVSHGFTMDGEGRKMSKSLGNTVDPLNVCDTLGADILRLWVASVEFQQDQRLSSTLLQQTSETYRKIRNTLRFFLGNLSGYDVAHHPQRVASWNVGSIDASSLAMPEPHWASIHGYALHRLERVREECVAAYDRYDFHTVVQTMHHFLAVEMSAFYLDIMKDTLYADAVHAPQRVCAQMVLLETLLTVTPLLTPILPHTAEEVWQSIPGVGAESIQAQTYVPVRTAWIDHRTEQRWQQLIFVRETVFRALEQSKQQKQVTNSMAAAVHLVVDAPTAQWLRSFVAIEKLLIVATVTVETTEEVNSSCADDVPLFVCPQDPVVHAVHIGVAPGQKCERCWNVTTDVGECAAHPTVCRRCAEVLLQSSI